MDSAPENRSSENPVWSEARERYRQVPLGLELSSFHFPHEPSAPRPVPGKPWVAMACDPNDEHFWSTEFCDEQPGAEEFEQLLLGVFEGAQARAEFVELADTEIAMDIASFCRALDIRIEMRDQMPMTDKKIAEMREAIVADATRDDDAEKPPERD